MVEVAICKKVIKAPASAGAFFFDGIHGLQSEAMSAIRRMEARAVLKGVQFSMTGATNEISL